MEGLVTDLLTSPLECQIGFNAEKSFRATPTTHAHGAQGYVTEGKCNHVDLAHRVECRVGPRSKNRNANPLLDESSFVR